MSDKTRSLPVPGADAGPGVGRRELLQGLFAGVGAGLALPGAASGHPPLAPAVAAETQAKVEATDWTPAFLDPHQLATLDELAERVVPGARAAHAARFIDTLLAVDSQERQRLFLTSLGAIDGEALRRFQRPFRGLAEADQVAILGDCAATEPGRKEWIWTPGTPVEPPPALPEVRTLRDHFDHLKGWVADAYYSSPAGRAELGDKGQTFFASFPDCQHKDHA